VTRPDVLVVSGARPNFMKVAPILTELHRAPELSSMLVHTGQHYDEAMSGSFFRDLDMAPPDLDLGVGSGSHAAQTAAVLERFEPVLEAHRPGVVLVVGDVNSTLACALAAAKLTVPVAHVEAGLRSFDRGMPEEINRVLTDAMSDLLFVTEPSGVENLLREGKSPSAIHLVGNVMIDTLLSHRDRAKGSTVLDRFGVRPGEYAVLTLHRPANVDVPDVLARILEPVLELAANVPVLYPAHPRASAALRTLETRLAGAPGFRIVEPLGYLDFLRLIAESRLVLTDSGGVQEETTILKTPCVTLRANTERPITVSHGTNRIAGTTAAGIREAIRSALDLRPETLAPIPLWDGKASERIGAILRRWLER
jgi:UDP-N-acetylglucosamine 2-epimerase (non-hydrolysing)